MLTPQSTKTRLMISLNGRWKFKVDDGNQQVDTKLSNYKWVAVPGSYNSQIIDVDIDEHVGDFWYETEFQVPKENDRRYFIHFGSVSHKAIVYLNGYKIVEHTGGFTPFEAEVTEYLRDGNNILKVKGNNILDDTTLPSAGYHNGKEEYRFDFFNFAGIHRSVKLYATNLTRLKQIHVKYKTDLRSTTVIPIVSVDGPYDYCEYTILNQEGKAVSETTNGEPLKIKETHLWWPGKPYMYSLLVNVYRDGRMVDSYTKDFGVRTVEVRNNSFLINNKPFYFKGFGKHEDFIGSGKGLNEPAIILDHEILKSIGANSYRTAHYPYSEEQLDQADKDGIVIIDEMPAVGLFVGFNVDLSQRGMQTWDTLKTGENHKKVIKEVIERDMDHPSVVMWSLANETAGHVKGAREYFEPLVKLARKLDFQHRPLTWVSIVNDDYDTDLIGDLFDVVCLNRYYGWYIDHGDLNQATCDLRKDIQGWHKRFPDKPIIFTEFGADTVPGMHSLEHAPYSEEYQKDLYEAYFKVFDEFSYVVGEQLWAFADFKTSNNLRRIDGNLKGVFTRDRRPKAVVDLLKKRWLTTLK
ncbi:beta-glucuronidase [Ligilactobacillus sp. LYQ60]|uniref:beta-glucuronidase n=1 Tax=unclassified Ligilactobacillus TaxID=2767920 RepID=UPI0038549D68